MSELDKALDRLGDAISELLAGAVDNGATESQLSELSGERDRLKAELDDICAKREEDAQLRAEAADAVRDALRDLRGLVAARSAGGAPGAKAAGGDGHG